MRREPSLTLQGALQILGEYEPGIISKLDILLGSAVLAAGVGVGLATAGGAAMAPLAAFAAVWGWVEQKNEAIGLLRQATAAISKRLMRTGGLERRRLIAAAHTAIVAAAVFESLRTCIGEEAYKRLAVTEAEKKFLISDGSADAFSTNAIDLIYVTEIPAPSSSRGFEENTGNISAWASNVFREIVKFINGLDTGPIRLDLGELIKLTVERYRSHYIALAAKVPEFYVWAVLGEHAATRTEIKDLGSDLLSALSADADALARVEALLALQTGNLRDQLDLCAVMERANRSVLDQPIIPSDAERYGTQVIFPAVSEIYINPRYRVAPASLHTRPADGSWWEERQSFDNIDLALAGHAMAPDATRFPMLLLGDPGAGKSLLTKVLAARLASANFTVVRVPLRQVSANAPISDQIQQALDQATHERVKWWQLAEQSTGQIRVILLDGLDELLQASSNDRSGYLRDVMEFQRIEAVQKQPVIVIVTSRTVVADRVDIPAGTTIVKLDFFEAPDIKDWLRRWADVNADLISAGAVRELTVEAALKHQDLAKQPLLLLMLVLYSADPGFPALDSNLSTADLYHRLLDNFARREVAKRAQRPLKPDELRSRVQDQLDRLSVAALAMFNRGRQDITEAELGVDLAALSPTPLPTSRPAELGQRLIGEFFFVHAAEAHLLAAATPSDRPNPAAEIARAQPSRAYEFLHATFSEYLVASRVMNELADVAQNALGGRRSREPEDDLLFALLSHRPLAVRRSTLNFASEIFAKMPKAERANVLKILDVLLKSYRYRHGSDRYATYRPLPQDRIRELAAFSANLITLRLTLTDDDAGVPLSTLFDETGDLAEQWRSTVTLWRSGLEADGQQAMASSLKLSTGSVRALESHIMPDTLDVAYALLIDDTLLARRIRFGLSICDLTTYYHGGPDEWYEMMLSWLVPNLAGISANFVFADPVPKDLANEQVMVIAKLLMRLLRSRPLSREVSQRCLGLLFSLPRVFDFDTRALATISSKDYTLVVDFPELRNPAIYGLDYPIVRLSGIAEEMRLKWPDGELRDWLDGREPDTEAPATLREVVARLLEGYLARDDPDAIEIFPAAPPDESQAAPTQEI